MAEQQQSQQQPEEMPQVEMVLTTIKQQTIAEFTNALKRHINEVGEAPHIYRLCHSHRASCIEHIDKVENDNVVVVDRPDCMICQS